MTVPKSPSRLGMRRSADSLPSAAAATTSGKFVMLLGSFDVASIQASTNLCHVDSKPSICSACLPLGPIICRLNQDC